MEHEPLSEVDRWVHRHLHQLRAPLRQRRTVFGSVGRFRPLENGELTVYGPNGKPIKVVEVLNENTGQAGGTQIEDDEGRHAVIRPGVVTSSAAVEDPTKPPH